MDLSEIRVDPALVEHGGWVSDIPGLGDIDLHVRPLNNPKYVRLQTKLIGALPRARRIGGTPDEDAQERIISTCLLQTVLLGWRNVKEDGVDVPFTPEAARKYMLEPQYRDFRDGVLQASTMVRDSKTADEEEIAKN